MTTKRWSHRYCRTLSKNSRKYWWVTVKILLCTFASIVHIYSETQTIATIKEIERFSTQEERNLKQYYNVKLREFHRQRVAKNFHGWSVIENEDDNDDKLDLIGKSLSPRCLPRVLETVSATANHHLVIRLAKSSQVARMSFLKRETSNICIYCYSCYDTIEVMILYRGEKKNVERNNLFISANCK